MVSWRLRLDRRRLLAGRTVAAGSPRCCGPSGTGSTRGRSRPGRPAAGPATKSSQLIDAINWAVAENSRKGSPYDGKLDVSKIAVMGMSCGGIQAYAVATDPRVKLVGIFNSGIFALIRRARPGHGRCS